MLSVIKKHKDKANILISVFIAGALIFGSLLMSEDVVYSSSCSDFNGNQSSCEAQNGCSYPGNAGSCSIFNGVESTCGATAGCTQNFGDCTPYSDGGGDGSACVGYNAQCSYDSGSGACTGTPFVSCSGSYDDGTCVGSYDTTGPILSTAAVSSNSVTLTLTYNEALNTGSIPENTDFVVYVDGTPVTVNSPVTVTGSTVILTLATSVGAGTVTLDYTLGGNAIQDIVGNNAASYTGRSVTNNTDITPPSLISFTSTAANGAYSTGQTINISANFNENLNAGSMTVVLDTGAQVTLNAVSGSHVSGTYTVGNGQNSPDLTVSSITSSSVLDANSNAFTGTDLPGSNIADSSAIVVSDTTAPSLTAFYSTAANGAYTTGQTIDISADFSENLGAGSTMTVVLDTGAQVTLNAVSGSHVSGTYTVGNGQNSPDLTVSSITSSSVLDANSNAFTGTDLPGSNIADSNAIKVAQSCTILSSNSTLGNSLVFGGRLYVSDSVNGTVKIIDTTTDTVIKTLTVGSAPGKLQVANSKIYVNNTGGDTISVINTVSDTVIGTISIGSHPRESISVGDKLYVSSNNSNMYVIDTSTDTVTTISIGRANYYFNVLGSNLYVSTDVSIVVIDTITGTVTNEILTNLPYYPVIVGSKMYINALADNKVVVIDLNTNAILTEISVGAGPNYSTALGGKLYVTNGTGNSVSIIDTNTNTLIKTIIVGSSPGQIVSYGDKVYVNNSQSKTVSVIDTNTDTVSQTLSTFGLGANHLVLAGKKLYINGSVVIDASTASYFTTCKAPQLTSITSSTSDGTFTSGESIDIVASFNKTLASGSKMRIVLNTNSVVNLTSVSGSTLSGIYTVGSGESTPDLSVSSISIDPSYTNVSDTSSPPNTNSSYSVPVSPDLTGDTSSNLGDLKNIVIGTAPLTIPAGINPYQMVTVGNYTYVANQGSDNITVFNNTDGSHVATTTVGSQPYGMAYNGVSKEIYVANLKANTVSVIDADPAHAANTFNTVTNTITVGIEPYYVASLGTNVYVTNNLSNTVSVIATGSHTVTNTISVGVAPRGIKARGTDLYVANFGSNYGGSAQGTVSVINSINNTVSTTINAGNGPRGVTVNGTDVYVANFNSNTVSRIDTTNSNAVTTINVGTNPRGMLALNNKIYVENYQDGTISIIDGTTHAVTGPYKVGNTPAGMAAIGNDIAISRFTDGLVNIFDTTNLALRTDFADNTAPIISSVNASVTATTAALTWTTGENATSTVAYGLTASYGFVATSSGYTLHSATLTGLTANTLYHYQISARDASLNTATTSDATFTTAAEVAIDPLPSGSVGGGSTGGGGGAYILPYQAPAQLIPNTANPQANIIINPNAQADPSISPKLLEQSRIFKNPNGTPFVFAKNLTLFTTVAADAKKLQIFLNAVGFPVSKIGAGSPGFETSWFGPATRAALARFQKAVGIAPAIGNFGPITRAYVNKLIRGLRK